MSSYRCGECGADQFQCSCWEMEAAVYIAGAQEGQDRLEKLRRAHLESDTHGGPMTLDEARANVGRSVVYRPDHGPSEDGVITGVSERFVFVRYRGQHPDAHGQATPAELLEVGEVRHG